MESPCCEEQWVGRRPQILVSVASCEESDASGTTTDGSRFYMLWMNALDVDEEGNTHGSGFAATTNNFEIAGGPTLYSKEIAGVVIGTLAALILFFGVFRVGARCLRKRKSLAVNLSEAPEGGYSDSVTNAGTPDIIVTTR